MVLLALMVLMVRLVPKVLPAKHSKSTNSM
jgi:hypothetical protein